MARTIPLIALLCLAACGTPEVAEDYEEQVFLPAELSAALASDDPTARADAATQVEALPAAERLATLSSLAVHDNAAVRLMAIGLLGKLHAGDPTITMRLAEVIGMDADIDVRMATVPVLAKSGEAGLAVLVEALSDDPSLFVRREIAVALDRVTGNTFGAAFAEKVGEAEDAADDAMMDYDDWLESQGNAGERP